MDGKKAPNRRATARSAARPGAAMAAIDCSASGLTEQEPRGEKGRSLQGGEVPVPMVKGNVERARRPFEDKVKKVQTAPRMRPLLGPGSSRSPSRVEKEGRDKRYREREGVVKRGGKGSVVRETRQVCWWRSRPLAGSCCCCCYHSPPCLRRCTVRCSFLSVCAVRLCPCSVRRREVLWWSRLGRGRASALWTPALDVDRDRVGFIPDGYHPILSKSMRILFLHS